MRWAVRSTATTTASPAVTFIVTVTGNRVSPGGALLVREDRRQSRVADVLDRLLTRGELAEVKSSVHAESKKRIALDQKVSQYMRGH
jgi:hypothetical protein